MFLCMLKGWMYLFWSKLRKCNIYKLCRCWKTSRSFWVTCFKIIKCRHGWIYHRWNLNFWEQDLLGNNHILPVYTHSKVLSWPSWSCFWWFLNEWMRYDAVFCRLLQEVGTGVLESGVQSETRLISRNFGKHHWIFDDGTFYPRFRFFSPPLQSYLTDLNLVLIINY